MAIPAFQDVMLPILKLTEDGQMHSVKEIIEYVERVFVMTESEKQERIPSGRQRTIYNRTTWAISHMNKAGLIQPRGQRGCYDITEEGRKLLSENPAKIDTKLLRRYASYRDFVNLATQEIDSPPSIVLDNIDKTPEEIMGELSEQLQLQLARDILDVITENSPDFFEHLVVDLLLKMGYGGLKGSGEVTKKTGDGGIDGIIKQDELGLDSIYIQAKKWDKTSSVGSDKIQQFAGAMSGKGVTKGVFITTGGFSKPAIDEVKLHQNAKIILIDGLALVKLMIKHDLGVSISNTILIKRIDSDYFEER
jgi:restriction system protein